MMTSVSTLSSLTAMENSCRVVYITIRLESWHILAICTHMIVVVVLHGSVVTPKIS